MLSNNSNNRKLLSGKRDDMCLHFSFRCKIKQTCLMVNNIRKFFSGRKNFPGRTRMFFI